MFSLKTQHDVCILSDVSSVFVSCSSELFVTLFYTAVVPAGEESELLVGVHNEGTLLAPFFYFLNDVLHLIIIN